MNLSTDDPRSVCEKCGHPVGDHHIIMGCQHLTPMYDHPGWLRMHVRCECKEGVEARPPCHGIEP